MARLFHNFGVVILLGLSLLIILACGIIIAVAPVYSQQVEPVAPFGSIPVLESGLVATVKTVKGARGALVWVHCLNTVAGGATNTYVQVFDQATSGGVTLGTTVPVISFGIPGGTYMSESFAPGIEFFNGIQVAATTTAKGLTAGSADCNFGIY